MLFELGGKIDRFADHRVLETGVITNGAKDDGSSGEAHTPRQEALTARLPALVPGVHLAIDVECRHDGIGREALAWRRGAKGDHHTITHELVDGAAMILRRRHDEMLVSRQHGKCLARTDAAGERGESPQVHEQDRGVPQHTLSSGHDIFGMGDPVSDFRSEEAGEILRRLTDRHRTDELLVRPGQRNDENAGDEEEGQNLVNFAADQDIARVEVVDVVARDLAGNRRHVERIDEQDKPSGDRRGARHQNVPRIKSQGAQRDQNEEVEHGRHLERKARGLGVLQVEAPDRHQQHGDVDHDRCDDHPVGQAPGMCEDETYHREEEVSAERPRHRFEHGVFGKRLGRERVEHGEKDDADHLHPADQHLAVGLIAGYLAPDTLGQVTGDRFAKEQDPESGGSVLHDRVIHRLVSRAPGKSGRSARTPERRRSGCWRVT